MRSGLVLTLAALVVPASAHIALWDPSMFGWDPNDPNQSEPVLPLMDLTFDQWWFHGYINKPPAANTFMTLPSGGTYHGQVACNKALTKYGQNPDQQTGKYACEGDDNSKGGIGAMHTADTWESSNPTDVKGCGLSIAYVSDEHAVQPEDFTVISTNYECPWFKNVDFQIPSDLPACPEEGCLCSWGWIHAIDAGSQQNYHLVYRCKVDGATGATPVPKANTANKCNYPADTSNCTVGAKQPHYWYQKERNNNPQGQYDPPFYNGAYGYMNGAQTDLFATVGGATTNPAGGSNSSASAAASVSSSAAASSDASSTVSSASISSAAASSAASSPSPVSSSAAAETSSAATTPATSSANTSLAASIQAINAAAATPSPSASSSSTAAPAASSSSSSKSTCKRRKRALDRLSDPELAQRHRARAAKRAARKLGNGLDQRDIGGFASKEREYQQARSNINRGLLPGKQRLL